MNRPEPKPAQTDGVLWQQLPKGSELALGKLINRYFNPLLNYGYKFIRDEAFVKDCVEVFIEIWNRRDRISTPDNSHQVPTLNVRVDDLAVAPMQCPSKRNLSFPGMPTPVARKYRSFPSLKSLLNYAKSPRFS